MKNKIKNIFSLKLLYIFILIQPVLDLLTSLTIRFLNMSITIGLVTRGLFLFFIITYLLFFNKSKYRSITYKYLIVLFIFSIFYFVLKIDIFQINYLYKEIIYMFKFLYFPIVLVGFINIFDQYKIDKEKIINIFQLNIIVICITILLAKITNTAFLSYQSGESGTVGWFYAANEISAIISILFPYLLLLLKEKKAIIKFIIILIVTFVALLIGTKTSYLGILIPTICFLIFCIFQKNIKAIILTAILLLFIFVMSPNSYVLRNFSTHLNKENNNKPENVIVSSRNIYFNQTYDIYKVSPIQDKTLGIGFVDRPSINNSKITKLIEMDFYDIFFHYGYLGTLVILLPFIFGIYLIIKNILPITKKITLNVLICSYSFAIGIAIAFMAGHVLGAPAVSIYVVLGIIMAIKYLNKSN